MADTIGSAGDPDRPPRRLLTGVVVGVLLVAVVGVVVTHHGSRPHHRAAPARARSLGSSPPIYRAIRGLSCDRCSAVLAAPPGRPASDATLVLAGSRQPLLIDARTATTVGSRRVPVGRAERITDVVSAGTGLIVQVGPKSSEQDPPRRVYDVPVAGPARFIGRADFLIPGAAGVCWLQTFPRFGNGPSRLVAVGPDGRSHGGRLAVPSTADVVVGVPGGVLTESLAKQPDAPDPIERPLHIEMRSVSERARILDRAGWSVLAAHDGLVAWSRADGSISTETLKSAGQMRRYAAPADPRTTPPADVGAFSPDDRQLAVAVPGLPAGMRAATNLGSYGYIEVINLSTGTVHRIGGIKIPPKMVPALGWLDSRTLLMELHVGRGIRLAGWDSRHDQTYAIGTHPVGVADTPTPRLVFLPNR